jgi:hypothetical protein
MARLKRKSTILLSAQTWWVQRRTATWSVSLRACPYRRRRRGFSGALWSESKGTVAHDIERGPAMLSRCSEPRDKTAVFRFIGGGGTTSATHGRAPNDTVIRG